MTMTRRVRTSCRRAVRPRATESNGGQGLVLLTLFLVTMIALVGLGVDGGSLYLHRRTMQNAADAAAFAGARLLSLSTRDTPTIRSEIETYAGKNYVINPASNVTAYYTDDGGAQVGAITSAAGTAPATATGVKVITRRQAPTFFLPIIGFGDLKASASAGAHGRPATGGGPGYAVFALAPNLVGQGVIDWNGNSYNVSGTVHSNSDIKLGGGGNTFNGILQDVTGTSPTNLASKATLNPSANNPVQSTVLPDPVNKTLADYYQGTTSTATYHYVSGNTNLSSFLTNGVFQPGVYYVNGKISLSSGETMSATQASSVTFVATGQISVSSNNMNFQPYKDGMLFFSNASSGDGVVIQGNYGNWNGVAYAPHANVKLTGSNNVKDPHASLVGWTIQTTGAGQTLIYDDSLFPQPTAAEITLYE